ncbi:MAG TPA: hypothetical protein VEY10_03435 [Flavisolibacter sp.]|nr:hypothetical protein [Flavisolibacter sp.]
MRRTLGSRVIGEYQPTHNPSVDNFFMDENSISPTFTNSLLTARS